MEGLHMTIRTRFSWARRIRVYTLPLVFVLAVVWLLVGLKAQGPAPEYTVTDLEVFEPAGLSSSGNAVGYAMLSGHWHSFLWSKGVLKAISQTGGQIVNVCLQTN
jgi:hypothetical protein